MVERRTSAFKNTDDVVKNFKKRIDKVITRCQTYDIIENARNHSALDDSHIFELKEYAAEKRKKIKYAMK